MADRSPQQNPTIIIKNIIDATQITTTAGNSAPQGKTPHARDDHLESLPDPLCGIKEHVEPGFWASWFMDTIFTKSRREHSSSSELRNQKPIREPIFRTREKGKKFLSKALSRHYGKSAVATRHYLAGLMQMVGRLAETACWHCSKEYEPFITCVVVDGILDGCCANCRAVGRPWECSHRKNTRDESGKRPKRGYVSSKTQLGAKIGPRRYIARSHAPRYRKKKPRHSIRALMLHTARQTKSVQTSMKRLSLEIGKILSTHESKTSKTESVQVGSKMQGLNVEVDTLQEAIEELAAMVMECDDDVAMQSGDEIDNAIMVSDDEDAIDEVVKMDTVESQGVKTESSKCEEDDESEIKKEKQNVDEDTCEHKAESKGITEINKEGR